MPKKDNTKKAVKGEKKALKKNEGNSTTSINKIKKKKEVVRMMDDDDGRDDSENDSLLTTDKMGNTITKQAAKQNAAAEEMRVAAKARRAAKANKDPTTVEEEEEENTTGRPQWLVDYDQVKAKLAMGEKKLSRKEKKLLKRGQEREAEDTENAEDAEDVEETPLDKRLEGFSLSLTGGSIVEDDEARDVVVKGISISAPEKPLLVNADLSLVHGRRYGLIGTNGSGKSTLLRFLASRRIPVPKTIDILLVEQEVSSSNRSVLEEVLAADTRRLVLLKEEKDLFTALEEEKVADVAAACNRLGTIAEEYDAIGANDAEARVQAILCGLGFTEAMVDGPSSKLSGGWRMRVSLARALFAAPKLLLLDEPTNHLDLDAVLWLDSYLTGTDFPKNSTVLTVSHDRDFLDETCTDLILLTDDGGLEYHRGGLKRLDEGTASRNAKRAKDYKLQQKVIKQERAKHPSLTIDKLTSRLLDKLDVPRFAEKPKEYKVHFNLVAPDNATTGAGLSIDLRDVHFSYEGAGATTQKQQHDGAFQGFEGLNLCISSTTRASIVGANGSGKSTLLKLITGDLAPTKGEVNHGRHVKIGYYDQHFSELKNCARNASAVDYLLSNYGDSLSSSQEARKWLGMFGLDSARHVMPVRDLSGGQKARVCFASIALRRPHLLILDEPTNHLDLESVDALVQGLEAYGGGVLA